MKSQSVIRKYSDRLKGYETVAKDYTNTIDKYFENGYAREVDKDTTTKGKWYLLQFSKFTMLHLRCFVK